jgi:hypothetical protein
VSISEAFLRIRLIAFALGIELLYYTAMEILSRYRDQLFLLFSIIVVIAVLFNITNDAFKTNALANNSNPPKIIQDPQKDFKSLDNYLSYSIPAQWQKTDQVDQEFGMNTLIALSSPDFESSSSGVIDKGVRVTINRSYDPRPEETVKNKLNTQYPFYDYNIRGLVVDGKNAMTMHEDYNGHNRFIFIASGEHLWQIGISSKNLEEEQRYEAEINSFLNSVKF